jgi:hypothetical protein
MSKPTGRKNGRPTKHEARYKNVGRPSVMTPEVIAKLEEAFSNAMTDNQACFLAGISHDSLDKYVKKNPSFGVRKELLKKSVDITAKKTLVGAVNGGDLPSVKFWLERKCKDEFSVRNELTGKEGKPIELNMNIEKDEEDYLKNVFTGIENKNKVEPSETGDDFIDDAN